MFKKIVSIFVIIINCLTAEDNHEYKLIGASCLEKTCQKEPTTEASRGTTDACDNKTSTLDTIQHKNIDDVNQTFTRLEAAVDEAKEKWAAWLENYNCSNSTNLVKCVTSVRTLKGLYSWKNNTSEVEIPTELPSGAGRDDSDDTWPHKITHGLKEWFSSLNKFISKSKELTKNKSEQGD